MKAESLVRFRGIIESSICYFRGFVRVYLEPKYKGVLQGLLLGNRGPDVLVIAESSSKAADTVILVGPLLQGDNGCFKSYNQIEVE